MKVNLMQKFRFFIGAVSDAGIAVSWFFKISGWKITHQTKIL